MLSGKQMSPFWCRFFISGAMWLLKKMHFMHLLDSFTECLLCAGHPE